MSFIRSIRAPGQFVLATLGLSAAALLQTWLAQWPGRTRLEYPIFYRLFVFTDDWGAALQLLMILFVIAVPAVRRAGSRLAIMLGNQPRLTACVTLCVFVLGATGVYRATPFAMDESAQVAQAFAFAHGELSWFVPSDFIDRVIPVGFRNYFFAVNAASGEVASMYWPGFAALLAPFAWLQVPWLLNPLLGAASVRLVHALALKLGGTRETAGWAVLFTLASPVFMVNSISFYAMPAHLAFNLFYAWLLLDGRASRAFLAGLVGGWALVLHNPVPHMLFALPWLVWLVLARHRWPALLAVLVGYVPIGLVIGFAWPRVTAAIAKIVASGPAASPWTLILAKMSAVLRVPDSALVEVHLEETWKIVIWASPGLLILLAAGFRRARGPTLVIAASLALTYLAYWFVPFDQGHGWGYRYVYSAWAALPLLSGAFIAAQDPLTRAGMQWREWAGGLALASLVSANVFWCGEVHSIIGEHMAQRIAVPPGGRWVLFMTPRTGLYPWDMIQNRPGDIHQWVFMSFGTVSDARFMARHFPDARVARVDARGSLWRLARDP